MASVSGVSLISNIFSKLGDNTGSVIPMFAKDLTSNALISHTYFKDSGKLEGGEKTLEEFGTGVIWLGGIPFFKKFVFDKFIYKKSGVAPEIDAKKLFAVKNEANSLEFARQKAKDLGQEFSEQGKILENAIKNKGLAKKLSVAKFGISTALTGALMFGLITLKQKKTEKELKEKIKNNSLKSKFLKDKLKENPVYQNFKQDGKKEISFTGAGTFFMTNPVANTAIIDTVITTTRLGQARAGERGEIGFKEMSQLLFVYGLAKPMQSALEFVSKAIFKKDIKLDYPVLNSSVLKNAIEAEKANQGASDLLNQAKHIIKLAGNEKKISDDNAKKILEYIYDNQNSDIADVLKKSGIIGIFKTSEGKEQIDLLSSINVKNVKKTAQDTIDLIENSIKDQDITKYLKKTKLYKGSAIAINILASAILMGVVQPKLNMYFRKKKQNGDNTNPAIKNLEDELKQKIAFEGIA